MWGVITIKNIVNTFTTGRGVFVRAWAPLCARVNTVLALVNWLLTLDGRDFFMGSQSSPYERGGVNSRSLRVARASQ